MKKILTFIFMFIHLLANAQEEGNYSGIKFEQGLTWEQIKAKAKIENKYIFVDCYATWCLPCKLMDRDVYPNEKVGAALNDAFISVKVQMDTGKYDDENIQRLYGTARELTANYNINALPTFLFFSPDGKVVHKDVGSKTPKEFISLTKEAVNPSTQFYKLINDYQSDKMSYTAMPAFLQTLKSCGEDSLSRVVAKDYMHGYLDKLSDDDFCTKENLYFFASYLSLINSHDRVSKLYYNYPDKVDSAISHKGYAKDCLNRIITNEEIKPAVDKAGKSQTTPDWKEIHTTIKNKYNDHYAFDNIIDAKLNWYYSRQEWSSWLSSVMDKWKENKTAFNKYNWLYLNHLAWTVCVHSNNKKQLATALVWAELGISNTTKPEVPILDTKANLLYKIGNRQEAIAIHTQIVELYKAELKTTTDEADKTNIPINIVYYQNIIAKMKKGEPIEFKD